MLKYIMKLVEKMKHILALLKMLKYMMKVVEMLKYILGLL